MTTGPLELAWYGADLRTGAVAEELRSLRPSGQIGRRIGSYTSVNFDLDLAGAPDEWESATDPGRTLLVAVDTATEIPVWGGPVLTREGGSDDTVRLAAATPEVYLDRRYPGAYAATGLDQSTVMAALAAPALTGGPPITLETVSSGIAIDYTVVDGDDRSILSYEQEIGAMAGGPELTADVVWADAAHSRFAIVLRIRPTIGVQSDQPEAVFDMPGCIASYSLAESYERGRGATCVVARGDRTGGERATSTTHQADALLAAGWPLWEHRWAPGQGITSADQLERHAAEAIALMGTGSRSWSLQAEASRAPRLGSTWGLGDSVRLAVEYSPRHPRGVDVVARAWGWTLDPAADRLAPILLEDA
ncbi:hypothetical protein ACFVFS_05565 [Kitasatospora sp. NPDC057692]|uniref:hypothetical protein n=1 Tax=Kitasatospora sp. NPDC057692 TaxID=3346215 RepID=UPI0036925B02